MPESIYNFSAESISGDAINLSDFKGKYLLIVNTASKCGFTPQYHGLENLYKKYKDRGLEVLAFPCNQFANQEPGDLASIRETCSLTYGVTFPLFSKVNVNGNGEHPLFSYLKKSAPGLLGSKKIKWNFTKFLVGPDGKVLQRFAPIVTPNKIEKIIESYLA